MVEKRKQLNPMKSAFDLPSRSKAHMPVWCQLCDIHFEEPLELEVHHLSLSHHIKLEAVNPVLHSCQPCGVTGLTLGEYSKHVDTEEHRKKRDRMRAIIDTMDAGEERRVRFNALPDKPQYSGCSPDYYQSSSTFVRSAPHRRTYPALENTEKRRLYGERSAYRHSPSPHQHKGELHAGPSSYQQSYEYHHRNSCFRKEDDYRPSRPCRPSRPSPPRERTPPKSGGSSLGFSPHGEARNNGHYKDTKFHSTSAERCYDDYRDGRHRTQPGTSKSSEAHEDSDEQPISQKRGLLARLSLRRKEKTSGDKTEKSEKEDKKSKKKKPQSRSPTSSSGLKSKASSGTGQSLIRRRTTVFNVPMKDKNKKWELVAVKGKASYLKNRSQRMLKDRLSKYRLIDNKGIVIEDAHNEGPVPSTSRERQSNSESSSGSSMPQFTSHIWGTYSEALPRSEQCPYCEHSSMPTLPSAPAPVPPQTQSVRSSQEDLSSGYATMRDLPMSTPKNFDIAVRAYENYEGHGVSALKQQNIDSKVPNGQFVSTDANDLTPTSDQDTSSIFSLNSSMALDSHSLTSRMNITAVPNANAGREVIEVKEEAVESPPPDALPSPPQFEQMALLQASTTERRIAGDKERDEFWALGFAEHKKGHEILETRAKVEALQKELFEATSYLRKLEVEMNEILRRKSELLGLPPPSGSD